MIVPQSRIKAFQKEILDWYSHHQRDLPWRRVPYDTRLKQRDPYKILVSEVMLQQTQVQRVIPKYEEWLKAFPSLTALANASPRDVLLHWSGLGYNRRALYLQKFAQSVVKELNGVVPQDEKILRSLPGIGEYTARALLCFAFDMQVAVVDTNIRKVIAVKFFKSELPEEKVIQEIARELLPQGKAYEWNQALMDYAGSMLKEHKIPIPKQSKFKDSNRFFRGLIVRILLAEHRVSLEELLEKVENTKNIDKMRLEKIIQQMEGDGLVQIKNNEISVPDEFVDRA